MDALYLKENVNEALMEALTAMAVAQPEDRVNYVGRYLLQYVERKRNKANRSTELIDIEEKVKQANVIQSEKDDLHKKKVEVEAAELAKVPAFISSITSPEQPLSKTEIMDKTTAFLAEYLNVPACYIAIKKQAGESENLHYYSANPGQEHVRGKKLPKPVEEGDEVAPRQGFSYDVFRIPEAPPEEEPAEGEEGAPPKPPPKPVPLVIENVMRDKRCKFFGIPKLGSFVAVPLSLASIDHEAGCQAGVAPPPPEPVEGEEPPPPQEVPKYMKNPLNLSLFIAVDTIGKYRLLKEAEIKTIEEVGTGLVAAMEKAEDSTFQAYTTFLDGPCATMGAKVGELVAGLPEAEAAALAAVAAELTPAPAAPSEDPEAPPPEPVEPPPEALKVSKETAAVLAAWTAVVTADPFASILKTLKFCVIPPSQSAANLLYWCGVIVGMDATTLKDVCGDISWDGLRLVLPALIDAIKAYDPLAARPANKETSIAAIKAGAEAATLADPSIYPAHLPVLVPLSTWLTKAIVAREAAVVYAKDINNTNLEV